MTDKAERRGALIVLERSAWRRRRSKWMAAAWRASAAGQGSSGREFDGRAVDMDAGSHDKSLAQLTKRGIDHVE